MIKANITQIVFMQSLFIHTHELQIKLAYNVSFTRNESYYSSQKIALDRVRYVTYVISYCLSCERTLIKQLLRNSGFLAVNVFIYQTMYGGPIPALAIRGFM